MFLSMVPRTVLITYLLDGLKFLVPSAGIRKGRWGMLWVWPTLGHEVEKKKEKSHAYEALIT